jgi:hypothetical protein
MKQERVILSFIMVLIGLAFAGIIFYFYQSSKVIPDSKDKTTQGLSPTPTLAPTLFLTLDDPRDESIADKKTIRVAGKTNPEATVAIITLEGEEIVKPSLQGDFVTTITIDSGTNFIKVIAMTPDGETQTIQRVVSYTTEDF